MPYEKKRPAPMEFDCDIPDSHFDKRTRMSECEDTIPTEPKAQVEQDAVANDDAAVAATGDTVMSPSDESEIASSDNEYSTPEPNDDAAAMSPNGESNVASPDEDDTTAEDLEVALLMMGSLKVIDTDRDAQSPPPKQKPKQKPCFFHGVPTPPNRTPGVRSCSPRTPSSKESDSTLEPLESLPTPPAEVAHTSSGLASAKARLFQPTPTPTPTSPLKSSTGFITPSKSAAS